MVSGCGGVAAVPNFYPQDLKKDSLKHALLSLKGLIVNIIFFVL